METAAKPTKVVALRLMLVALTLGLWLRLGDGNPWRAIGLIVGGGLICWAWIHSFSRKPAWRTTAPTSRTCDGVEAAAALRLAAGDRRPRPRSSKLRRDVRCPHGAAASRRRRVPRRTRPSY